MDVDVDVDVELQRTNNYNNDDSDNNNDRGERFSTFPFRAYITDTQTNEATVYLSIHSYHTLHSGEEKAGKESMDEERKGKKVEEGSE